MFGKDSPKKEDQKEKDQKKEETQASQSLHMKVFSDMTQTEIGRAYTYYLKSIEKDWLAPDLDLSKFPAGSGKNIVNFLKPHSYQYHSFCGVFGESCGFVAYDLVLERYVFLKLALSRFSPKKGSIFTQIWAANDFNIEFNNPFQKRWSRGSRIQYGLYLALIKDQINFFTIPSINAYLFPGFFLEMDYIHGKHLLDWTLDKTSGNIVLQMFYKIMHAVDYLHNYRVIHRDLKPDNIRIEISEEDETLDRPVLLDFGLSKILTEERTRDDITCVGYAIGNPLFRSPTQETDSARATFCDDVYTLGLVLWSMLHKAVPRLTARFNLALGDQKQAWLNELGADLPPVLRKIFYQATVIDESKRYPTLAPMIRDFEKVLKSLKIPIPNLNKLNTINSAKAEANKDFTNADTVITNNKIVFSCYDCKHNNTCNHVRLLNCNDILKVYLFMKGTESNENE